MKTLIISDINGTSESIIPYGLNIGKHTETPVQILHIIDSRKEQGVSSPYADSKSVAPGEKLSHERILQREESKANFAIDKLLSYEASRLNYPLKIDVHVESNNVKKGIVSAVKDHPDTLLIASLDPENSMITSLEELLSITSDLGSPALYIPPEHPFRPPKKVLLYTDFTDAAYESIREIVKWLYPFRSIINALGISKKKGFMDMELKSSAWKKVVEEFTAPPLMLKTTIITRDGYKDALLDYIERNDPEMVIIPKRILENGMKKIVNKGKQSKTVRAFSRPVLLY